MFSSCQCLFLKLSWSTNSHSGQLGCRPPHMYPNGLTQPKEALEGGGTRAARTHVTCRGLEVAVLRSARTCVDRGGPGWARSQAQDPHSQQGPWGGVAMLRPGTQETRRGSGRQGGAQARGSRGVWEFRVMTPAGSLSRWGRPWPHSILIPRSPEGPSLTH